MSEGKMRGGKTGVSLGVAVWFMTCIAILGLSSCGNVDLTDTQYIQRAKDAQDQGDLRTSVIELKNALKQNPDNPEARWILGKIYVELGNGQAAEKELGRARDLGVDPIALVIPYGQSQLLQNKFSIVLDEVKPQASMSAHDQAIVQVLRGNAYLGEGALDEAGEALKKALSIQADMAAAFLGQGRLAIAQGNLETARDKVQQALAADPDSGESWSLMGDLERWQGNGEKAEEAYGKAISHLNFDGSERFKRALVRIGLDDKKGAEEDIQELKRSLPGLPAAHYAQGLLHFKDKQYGEARSSFEAALKKDPNYMPAIFYLGATNFVLANFEQAERHLAQFNSIFPHNDQAARLLGIIRLQNRDFGGALALLEKLLATSPEDVQLLNLVGNVHIGMGKTAKGLQYLNKAVELQPDSATTHAQIGLNLLIEGEQERGVSELNAAIELDPQLLQADVILVMSHLYSKQYQKAIDAAKRMREKLPESTLPLNLLAAVHIRKGDVGKAKELLRRVLEMEPGDPAASNSLAELALKEDDRVSARALYEAALHQHPGNLLTLMRLASLEADEGKTEEGKRWLEQAMVANPNALQPRVLLSRYYVRFGEPAKALGTIQGVKDIYPNNPLLLIEMGTAQLGMQQAENAAVTFQRLLNRRPNSAGTHYYLAQAYGQMGGRQRVRDHLSQALAIDNSHWLSKIALARLEMHDGDLERAGHLVEELELDQPGEAEVLALKGELFVRNNRLPEAEEAYAEALKQMPSSHWTIRLAQLRWQAGDSEASKNLLRTWLAEHPEDMGARYALAEAYMLLDDKRPASDEFGKIVELSPNHAMALNNLAWLIRKDDPGQARKYAERALSQASNAPAVKDTLGMILLESGEAKRGLRLIQDASTAMPGDLDMQYHFALALSRTGDQQQAIKVLDALLQSKKAFVSRAEAEALRKSIGG